ncbi:hypothetical protein KC19_4G052700 [Ceratodon purpureus]|uniref:BHLH domain-containing protein n=1 Tax=Ceratodon purpureus TaxID=3225 RepID=A0A8T0I823_CERPU|nr:hypothetical protein KC19_4G052700 [Ceratodon purpureus]
MPSQRRVSNFPEVGRNVVTANLHAAQFSYSLPGCTPQAHCRSESVLGSLRYDALTPLADMDNWFPANGFDVSARMSCGGSQPVTLNFQHPSERHMGSNVDDDAVITNGAHQANLSSLGDFQADTWWPSMTVNAIASRDRRSPQRVTISNTKPASNASAFPSSYAMESWCHDVTNPIEVASVDLNTPSEAHPSAIALVSVAPAAADVAEEVIVTTRATKGGGRRAAKLGKSISAPTSPSELRVSKELNVLGVQKSKWNGKRPVSQRENHIWSERQRRKGMNYLFSTLRSLLPHPTSKTDKSTVVGEIIKYIQSLQVKLEELTKKQQQVLAARTLSAFHNMDTHRMDVTLPKAFVSNGLTLVDHSSDPSSMTAITALPPPGRESCLASYLGSNVGLHVCGLNVFITTSSPRGRQGLLQQLLVTIHKHDLDVINANISTSNASIFHCLHCQASQEAEFLNNALHSALQSVINNFC